MSHPGQLAFSWYGDATIRASRVSPRERIEGLPDDVVAELRGALTVGPDKVELVLRPLKLGSAFGALLQKLAEAAASPQQTVEPPPLAVPESRSKTGRAQAVRYGRATKEDASVTDLKMAAHSIEVARSHMQVAQRWVQVRDDLNATRHAKAARAEALAQTDNARALLEDVLVRFNFAPTLRSDKE